MKRLIGFWEKTINKSTKAIGTKSTAAPESAKENFICCKCKNEAGEKSPSHLFRNNEEKDDGQFEDVDSELLTYNREPEVFSSQFEEVQVLSKSTSSISTVSPLSTQYESYAPKYSTSNSMTINEWLTSIEIDMENYRTDDSKIQRLRFYLEDDALMWYIDEITEECKDMTWEECKEQMMSRYSLHEVRPIISAINIVYKSNETISKYYKDKILFLNQTDLHDIDKVALLSDGLPNNFRKALIAANLFTSEKWLVLATELEKIFLIDF